jgi:hypothetical protein
MSARATRRPARLKTAFQALERPRQLAVQVGLAAVDDLALGQHHQVAVDARPARAAAERFPQEALGPVALDRAADATADGEAQAMVVPLVGGGGQVEEPAVEANASAEDLAIVRTLRQPFAGAEVLVRSGLQMPPIRRRCAGGPSDDAS